MTEEQKIKHKQEMAMYRLVKILDGEYHVLERPYFYVFVYRPTEVKFGDMDKPILDAYNEYNDVEYLFINYDPYHRRLDFMGPRLNSQQSLSYEVKVKSKIIVKGLQSFPNNNIGIMTKDKKFGCLIGGDEHSIVHKADNQIVTKTEAPSCLNCIYGITHFQGTELVSTGCDNPQVKYWNDNIKCQYYEPIMVEFCTYCGEMINKPWYEHQYWVGDPMNLYPVCSRDCQEHLLKIINFGR